MLISSSRKLALHRRFRRFGFQLAFGFDSFVARCIGLEYGALRMDAAARVSARFADRTNLAALDGKLGNGFFIAHPLTPTKGEFRCGNAVSQPYINPDAITLPIAETDRQRLMLQAFDTALQESGNLPRTVLVLVLHEGAIDQTTHVEIKSKNGKWSAAVLHISISDLNIPIAWRLRKTAFQR